ncbi:MAG: hypothetical protein INF18_07170 [Methylobacterium sp.]|nr:hypothetical protein [Methylobacterium sp.]MCA3639070.1 hypothetical protein [Methylobacterium sp.]
MGVDDAREPKGIDAERMAFGKRLLHAEKLTHAGKSIKINAPKWAAAEVAKCIPYFRFYAENGHVPNDEANPLFFISPEDIAYEVWQAAGVHPIFPDRERVEVTHIRPFA